MQAKVNIESIRKIIRKKAPNLVPFFHNAALAKFDSAKSKMLQEYDEHPVTKEIREGEEDSESDSTESGTLGIPNLFAFIGFNKGDTPTEELKNLLSESIQLKEKATISYKEKTIVFSFPVVLPTKEEIQEATPNPFNGKSWVDGIEDGIWGLSHYLFGPAIGKTFNKSRSEAGIESKYEVRSSEMKPTPYLTKILSDFKKNLS